MRKFLSFILLLIIVSISSYCARPKEEKNEKKAPQMQTKPIKAEEYQIPEELAQALPGLVNDKIRIWREISPTINLVAYFEDYSLKKAIEQAARAFLVLLEKPEFKNQIDFWIIQIQPKEGPNVMVWGVKPEEVEQYKKTRDLKSFFRDSEYVLINDQIIEKGDERLKYF